MFWVTRSTGPVTRAGGGYWRRLPFESYCQLPGTYRSGLDTGGLPGRAAEAAGGSVIAAHLVADRLALPSLRASADAAFVEGMGRVLAVCGFAALAAALLTGTLLPNRKQGAPAEGTGTRGDADMARSPGDARQ